MGCILTGCLLEHTTWTSEPPASNTGWRYLRSGVYYKFYDILN